MDARRIAPRLLGLTLLRIVVRVDAEAIGDAVVVGEERDHLHGVGDRRVVEAVRAQGRDVGLADRGRRARELVGEVEERTIGRG